eukprot:jgi/Chrzof1/15136/Cz09g28150.t1
MLQLNNPSIAAVRQLLMQSGTPVPHTQRSAVSLQKQDAVVQTVVASSSPVVQRLCADSSNSSGSSSSSSYCKFSLRDNTTSASCQECTTSQHSSDAAINSESSNHAGHPMGPKQSTIVITASHFLPNSDLPHSKYMSKAVGCMQLNHQIDQVRLLPVHQ